jgi:hypothetical protein
MSPWGLKWTVTAAPADAAIVKLSTTDRRATRATESPRRGRYPTGGALARIVSSVGDRFPDQLGDIDDEIGLWLFGVDRRTDLADTDAYGFQGAGSTGLASAAAVLGTG